MLSSLSQLRTVELHDAIVGDVVLSVVDRTCGVSVKPDASKEQSEVHLSCVFQEVGACLVRLDFRALAEESWAGNVQNCRLDVDAGVARLYLAGGLIECSSRSFLLDEKRLVEPLDLAEGGAALADSLSELVELNFDESQLLSMTMSPSTSSCGIVALVKGVRGAMPMVKTSINFHDVSSCLATLDMNSLCSQGELGNVQSCQVDSERGIVRLYLRDGFIEVVAKSATLAQS